MSELRRSIEVTGLTFIGVGGVIGSGWLFAPQVAAQEAGPAAVVSWIICGIAILLLALTFAEVCGRLPVAGGLGRIPFFTHGRAVAAAMGWTAWLGYLVTAPIEVAVMLRYLSGPLPWLADSTASHGLSLAGSVAAIAMMALMTLLNAFGVALFAQLNTGLTIFKLAVPLLVALLIGIDRFSGANFTSAPSFAPMGLKGILSAISTGGVVFAFLGFRHAIDMAGETRRPQVTIPLALTLSVLICMVVYVTLQVVFVGALAPSDLARGWAAIESGHALGPLGAIAVALGMAWLSVVILAGAIVAPFGGALVSTGSNGRLALALARNGFFPTLLTRLSGQDIPLNALVLNFVVGSIAFVVLPFDELLALNGAALTLSFAVGPIALLSLRRQHDPVHAGFRLPFAWPLCMAAFAVATLIVYWSGWDTVWRLGVALAVGAVLFTAMHLRAGRGPLQLRQALWIVPYLLGIGLLSWLGDFGDGAGVIPFGWDMAAGAALGCACLLLAVHLRLPDIEAAAHREQIESGVTFD